MPPTRLPALPIRQRLEELAHDGEVLLNVLRCQLTYQGQAETNAEAWFNIAYVHGNQKAR